MKLNLIYCKNSQNIIGINNELLFTIPEDMKYFKNITSTIYNGYNNVVIMGYNTWKSIPDKFKPLKNRINIVITNNHYNEFNTPYDDSGIFLVFKSFELCYQFLKNAEVSGNILGKKFVIGGSQLYHHVYKNYNNDIDIIYETFINYTFDIQRLDSQEINYSKLNFNITSDKNFSKMNDKYIDDSEIILNENVREYFNGIDGLHGMQINIYQNKSYVNNEEKQYLNLMKNILFNNNIKDSRNSKVISSFGEKMVFDLRNGFPLLTTKKMPFKTILRELLWFINGCTDNDKLNEKNVHIWDQNSSKEFLVKQGLSYEENDLGPVYGFQWRHFGAKYINRYTDYNGLGEDQLQNVIDLIKKDPTSRRIILSAWNPCDLDKMALPPCHVMIQFSIDKKYIDAQMYQRSGDMFLGVPFNIASYALLLHIIGSITGYIPRYFHHVLGDSHIYMNHISSIGEQTQRVPNKFPKLSLKKEINDINNINENIFILEDYNHYPSIKAEMIA